MVLAILDRAGVRTGNLDVYLNVVGGVSVDEPAADLAIAMAVMSGIKGIALGKAVFAGEIGLTGAIRMVTDLDTRIKEARRMGFAKIVVPECKIEGADIVKASCLEEIIEKITGETGEV
jgi:DNA repair protein RadA/Sms